jgi:hypothetical protein
MIPRIVRIVEEVDIVLYLNKSKPLHLFHCLRRVSLIFRLPVD